MLISTYVIKFVMEEHEAESPGLIAGRMAGGAQALLLKGSTGGIPIGDKK
jgi:hypothetical protein